jgi:hypothetical protein
VSTAAANAQVKVTRIGRIEAAPELLLQDANGQALPKIYGSFDHFRS